MYESGLPGKVVQSVCQGAMAASHLACVCDVKYISHHQSCQHEQLLCIRGCHSWWCIASLSSSSWWPGSGHNRNILASQLTRSCAYAIHRCMPMETADHAGHSSLNCIALFSHSMSHVLLLGLLTWRDQSGMTD